MKFRGTVLLIITHLGIGGTEYQTLNLVRALVANGYKVRVLCLYRNLPMVVQEYENAGAEVYIISPQYNNPDIPIGYHKGWKLIRFLYSTLKYVLDQDNYQIIHVQYMTPGATIILILYYLLGQKNIIATAHTTADIYPNLRLIHYIQRHCVRAFTCITEFAERSFFGTSQLYDVQIPIQHRNHFTIYNTLPPGVIPMQHQRSHPYSLTIGVVSRLEPIKGMDLVIPAFARIHAKNPTIRLLVVGDGSQRALMSQQTKEAGLSDVVEFVGRQPQEKLQSYYDKIDILLMPSRSEGFGLTAIEGMARGCVVVASNVGGLPEVVKNGVVGLLHTSESVDSMVEKTMQLVNNKRMMAMMQKNAIDYVTRFSFAHYSELINDLYLKL